MFHTTEMNIDETDCVPLLKCTRVALRDEALQMLLRSTQQTNLEPCITYDFLSFFTLWFTRHIGIAGRTAMRMSPSSIVSPPLPLWCKMWHLLLSLLTVSEYVNYDPDAKPRVSPLASFFQEERQNAPPSSIQLQAELDGSVLQDLTEYITKLKDHPDARGGFGEIWKCTCSPDQGLVTVRFQCCFYQPFSRL
jgi:hypothetical protein